MPRLARPQAHHHASWLAALQDFGDAPVNGSGFWHWLPGRETSDLSAYEAFIADLKLRGDPAVPPEPGKVQSDYYWITDGEADEVVGFLALRHTLTPALLEVGGHIGFSVRPSRRREGHATRALRLALPRAAELGIESALVTCDDGNLGSQRAIEANGGRLEDVRNGKRRYWITTAPELRERPDACGPLVV